MNLQPVEGYKHLILAGIVLEEDLKDYEEIGLSESDMYYRAMDKSVNLLSKELINLLNPIEINRAKHLASKFKKRKASENN